MNNPGSISPKGRGRGRQKEMSASERVNHWVNQREARRLNKERWANKSSGEISQTGDSFQTNDGGLEDGMQILASKSTEESENGCAAKRHNVQLYVPPFLRAKKELEAKNNSLDQEFNNSACQSADNEFLNQKNEQYFKSEDNQDNVSKSDYTNINPACETKKAKTRGRGRKKPEVEIYVPRALRNTKHESKNISPIQTSNDSLSLEIHDKADSIYCDADLDINTLTTHSSHQTQSNSAVLHGYMIYNNVHDTQPPTNIEQCGTHKSKDIQDHNVVNKKVKFESTVDSSLPLSSGDSLSTINSLFIAQSSPSTTLKTTFCEQPQVESTGSSLTFEFYDPAVIAFLPSKSLSPAQNIQKPHDIDTHNKNVPNTMETSVQSFSYSQPINEIVTKSSSHFLTNVVQPQVISIDVIQTQVQQLPHDCQPYLYGFPKNDNNIERSCSHEQVNPQDVRFDHKNKQSTSEQSSRIQSSKFSDMKDTTLSSTMQNITEKHDIPNIDFSTTDCGTDIDRSENLTSGEVDLNVRELCQINYPPVAKDTLISECVTNSDVYGDLMTTRTEFSANELHMNDSKFKNEQSFQSQSDQTDLSDNKLNQQSMNSNINDSDLKQAESRSKDLVEDEGDTWDTLYDDNGDCLDDALLTELEEYVGKVEIDKPRINYLKYEPKEPELDFEGFGHILEIYDFSPELATCDLISAFREFSSRGFDVKWVDDTHALGIFSSSVAANEALKMIHPLLKLRPMSEASKKGQSKARHCQEFLQPYKARPETTSMAARRLVAGALGMSTPQVSREVRERERQKLKEAKEKRRQERQQKVDVWDGNFG